jgi:hypothetical protein
MSKIKGRKIVCYSRGAAALGYCECIGRRSFGGVGGFAGAQGGGFLCLMRCGLFCAAADAAADLCCHERKTSQAQMPQGGGERKRITGDYRETQLIGINFSTRNSTHTKTPRSQPYRMLAFLPLLFAALYSASILRLINYFKSYKSERRRWPG